MEWKVLQGRGSASLSVNYARVFTWEGRRYYFDSVLHCIEMHKVSLIIRNYMKIVLLLNSLLVILVTF